jgi:hypothetical protein
MTIDELRADIKTIEDGLQVAGDHAFAQSLLRLRSGAARALLDMAEAGFEAPLSTTFPDALLPWERKFVDATSRLAALPGPGKEGSDENA